MGAARKAKVDQRNCLGLMAKYEVGKRRDRRQIDRNHALENEAQKKEKTSGDARVAEGTREMMKLQKQVIAKKKAAYLTQKKLHWEKCGLLWIRTQDTQICFPSLAPSDTW